MNPLITMMAAAANNSNPAMRVLQGFRDFKRNWTPQAAQQQIDRMLASGQITQQQLEQARQMAQQLQGFVR